MPIPTRSNRDLQDGTDAKSKPPSTRLHRRTASSSVQEVVKQVAKTHQRATSLMPQQAKVGQTETSQASLLRKPSVRTNTTSHVRQPAITTREASKLNVAVTGSTGNFTSKPNPNFKQTALKPQFTAYQQHFSPKKPLRPASTASDTPPSHDCITTSHDTSEASHWRDELLQLRLMHAKSKQTLQKFENDARTRLASTFDALAKQNESILTLEQLRSRCISHTALREWLSQPNEVNSDKLQLLGDCLRDLDKLTAKDGRYSSLIKQFQAWFEHMILALDSRKQRVESTCHNLLFIEPIDSLWFHEAMIIQRKLEGTRQTLRLLGDADEGGVRFLVKNYRQLADNLCEELDSCVSIHKIALEQEDAWIENSLQRLLEGKALPQPKAATSCPRGVWEN